MGRGSCVLISWTSIVYSNQRRRSKACCHHSYYCHFTATPSHTLRFLLFSNLHPIDSPQVLSQSRHFWITAYLFFSLNPLGLAEQRAHWIAAGSRFPACNTALRRPLVSLQHLPLYTTYGPLLYHNALTTFFACCLRLLQQPPMLASH